MGIAAGLDSASTSLIRHPADRPGAVGVWATRVQNSGVSPRFAALCRVTGLVPPAPPPDGATPTPPVVGPD